MIILYLKYSCFFSYWDWSYFAYQVYGSGVKMTLLPLCESGTPLQHLPSFLDSTCVSCHMIMLVGNLELIFAMKTRQANFPRFDVFRSRDARKSSHLVKLAWLAKQILWSLAAAFWQGNQSLNDLSLSRLWGVCHENRLSWLRFQHHLQCFLVSCMLYVALQTS